MNRISIPHDQRGSRVDIFFVHYFGWTFSLFLALVVTFILGTFAANQVSATTSSITISTTDSVSLNMLANTTTGTFSTSDTTINNISVFTNNGTGYTLGIKALTEGGNALVDTTDSTKTIPSHTLATGVSGLNYADNNYASANNLNNTWGFRPSKYWDSTNNTVVDNTSTNLYFPAPSSTIVPFIIDKTSTANLIANEYNIALGARINNNMPPGSYANNFIIIAVANPVSYSITYDKNTTDTVTGMPDDITNQETLGEQITLSNSIPARDAYTFMGWCTMQVADGANCVSPATPYSAGSIWTIDQQQASSSLTLYARWKETSFGEAYLAAGKSKYNGYYAMQDMSTSICDNVHIGSIESLIDTRDNEVYNISKLQDGHCWMSDNLRLGGSSAIPLSPSNTNIVNNYTLPASGFCNSYTTGCINAADKSSICTHYGNSSGKKGVFYNFCAASGGSYCAASSTDDASSDVCPKNWRMPTGGGAGEISSLCHIVSGLDCSQDKDISMPATDPSSIQQHLGATLAGFMSPGGGAGALDANWFWASNYQMGGLVMMGASMKSSEVNTSSGAYRNYGFSIRCLAK